ncbi:MAG: hypothetical protein NVS2B12_14570 [Ktedonobacteraceae bacterium]
MHKPSIDERLEKDMVKVQFTSNSVASNHTSSHNRESRPSIEDGFLAQQALLGDERGFEGLVHRYNQQLFNFIYHTLGDYDQACDVLQKVFLKLYLALPDLKQDQLFKAWLFRVADHCCIDEIRLRRRKPVLYFSELASLYDTDEFSIAEDILETGPSPEEIAVEHNTQQLLQQAIDTLPVRYRAIVRLRYMAQMSFAEIEQALDIPQTTAKTYFHRAKPLLRLVLKELLS